MIYISLIDELGLDLDSISKIDSQTIIRLQKQLKAKAILNGESNLGETANLIDALKDESERANHLFVEKNKWLKKLLQGDFNGLYASDFQVETSSISDFNGLRNFLEPYLLYQIKPFLSEMVTKGNYNIMLNTLSHYFIFSEQVNEIIVNFFRSKLNFAQIYLSQGKLKENEYPVDYISNKTFIKCLNIYPNSFSDEINEVNSEIIEIYNHNRKRTTNSMFLFSARVMVAFGLLDVSNEYLKDILVSNATIAREWTFPQAHKRKSTGGFSPWAIVFVIFLVIKVIHFSSKSSSSNSFSPFDGINVNRSKAISDNNLITLNNINYIYPLHGANSKHTTLSEYPLEKYQNPYVHEFYRFYAPKNATDISRNMTYIKNKTDKELILFLLYKNNDKSVYIPKNDSIVIQIEAKDTLVFYSGNKFIGKKNSNIRYFEEKRYMSDMYIIDSINVAEPHDIDVFPELIVPQNESHGAVKKIDSVQLRNIAYEKKRLIQSIESIDFRSLRSN
ncbi:MAG: hypothetical protein ACSHXF_08425 [Aquaticitalea sp.]